MSIFTKIKNSTSTGVINALFAALNADRFNPFITKNDLNSKSPYDVMAFFLKQTGLEAPVLTLAFGTGFPSDAKACRPGTCPYTRTDGSIFCTSAACKWAASYVDVGTYRITMSETPKYGYTVLMSPAHAATTRFNIVKESATTFLIKTYTNTTLTDGLLDGETVEVKLLNY